MNLQEKYRSIQIVNAAEALYAMSLGTSALRAVKSASLEALTRVATEGFLEKEVVPTYRKKDEAGEYAVVCQFPVPPLASIRENADGSVSLDQHVRIEWSGGQVDDFKITHVYHFDEEGKITTETDQQGTTNFRRKA